MLYILRQYLLKSLLNRKQASRGLVKNNLSYCRKPYSKLINKANTKLVTVNIIIINAVNTHFYM
jgi:hypothetical protein